MRRLAAAAVLAFALAGCSDSPCQDLGERLCNCQPGTTTDGCKQLVEDQVNALDPSNSLEDYCQQRLDACEAGARTANADFCEWLLTEKGKTECGLTPTSPPPP